MPRVNFLTQNTEASLPPLASSMHPLHTVSRTPQPVRLGATTGAVAPMFSQTLSEADHAALHGKAERTAYSQLSASGNGGNLIRGESLHGIFESNKLRTLDGARFQRPVQRFGDSLPSVLPSKETTTTLRTVDYISYAPSPQVNSGSM